MRSVLCVFFVICLGLSQDDNPYNYMDLHNERGLAKSNGFLKNGNLNITDFSGNLIYEYPMFNKKLGPSSALNMKLVYNSNLSAVSANRFHRSDHFFTPNNPKNNILRNTPDAPSKVNTSGWILNVNNVCVQLFNWENRIKSLSPNFNTGNFISDITNHTNLYPFQSDRMNVPLVGGNAINRVFQGWHYSLVILPDLAKSPHYTTYQKQIEILSGDGSVLSFRLPSETTVQDETFLLNKNSFGNKDELVLYDYNKSGYIATLFSESTLNWYNKIRLDNGNGQIVIYEIKQGYKLHTDELDIDERYGVYQNNGNEDNFTYLIPVKIEFPDNKEINFIYDTNENINRLKPTLKKNSF